jgi:hypothetical protein
MENIFDNSYVMVVLSVTIALYIASLSTSIPKFVPELFNNPIFRVVVLFLVVVRGNKDPVFSLLLGIAYVSTLIFLNKKQAKEAFTNEQNN